MGLYYVAFGWYSRLCQFWFWLVCLVVWLVWFWWWFTCLDLVAGWFGLAFVVSVWCLCCAFAFLVFRCLCSLAFVFSSLRFWWFDDLFDYLLFDGSLFVGVCCLGVGFLGWFWLFCLVDLLCFCFLLFWSDCLFWTFVNSVVIFCGFFCFLVLRLIVDCLIFVVWCLFR